MNTFYNKLLVVCAIVLLLGGVYVYIANSSVSAATTDSSLSSSSQGPLDSALGTSTNSKIAADTAFLTTLTSLTKIKIDTSLFANASFNNLNDNTVILTPSITGRPNPFAPINPNAATTNVTVSPVVTNVPTQITATSAILNGTTNNTIGVSSAYFEYGSAQTLGKVTPPAKQSLIGTYGTSLTGLTKGTTYFYRAAAKVNNVVRYGDIISFSTN